VYTLYRDEKDVPMAGDKTYNVREARAKLPQLIDAVLRGEHVVLRRATDGAEIELIPHARKREPGRYMGRIAFAPDAFAPMGEADLAEWEDG
jgi:antitoxin (DNA-binding transcriptional repressor) of toxin-antitoxin stability system